MKQIIVAVLALGIASCAVDNEPVSSPAPDDDAVSEASSDLSAAPASNPCGFFICMPLTQCLAIEGAISRPAVGCNGTRTCCDL